jgi:hypothetical protein
VLKSGDGCKREVVGLVSLEVEERIGIGDLTGILLLDSD